ncbi:MAG TPA: RDD family protein [Ignavibacteriaceae bacterium]|jgi:uncharacterized RDD family membrane protein YckC|nr:MAG: RDD family protein [Ignavibacteria bacterium ADurb.Bin266]OQY74852.1 MAG: hypothetical protein B6D44_03220 [Ignavibacteriales bacterium UTCHB2]HQF42109.1 RDD family protein [Ignavibacteriaceae bacterium]HQI42147.1 RDD family protein [Ignavibacteriaceae bacterium]
MENIGIETTQNVDINYRIASLGDRIIAQILDTLIIAGYLIATILLWIYLNNNFNNSPFYYPTAIIIILYLPVFLYDFLCEVFLNGQSIGKKMMKTKVVKIDGTQPGIGSYFLRWILKPIDVFLTYGSVGLITMLINGKGQRLGDLAANTTVIKIKAQVKLEDILVPETKETYNVVYPQASVLSDSDIQIIKEVLNHRVETNTFVYQNLIDKTKERIAMKMGVEPDSNGIRFLNTVIRDYTHLNSN